MPHCSRVVFMIPVGADGEPRPDLIRKKKPRILDPKRWDVPYHQ